MGMTASGASGAKADPAELLCDIRTRRVPGEQGVRIECAYHKREVEECLADLARQLSEARELIRDMVASHNSSEATTWISPDQLQRAEALLAGPKGGGT